MPTYFTMGKKPDKPANETSECRKCVPTLNVARPRDLVFDTERDARVVWETFGQVILQEYVTKLWNQLWTDFKCKGDACKNRSPCGAKPTFIQVGAFSVNSKAGDFRWQLMIAVAREIQCVPQIEWDVTPEVPVLKPKAAEPEPKTPKPHELIPPKELWPKSALGDPMRALLVPRKRVEPKQKPKRR